MVQITIEVPEALAERLSTMRDPLPEVTYRKYKAPFHAHTPASAHPAPPGAHPPAAPAAGQRWTPQAGRKTAAAADGQPA